MILVAFITISVLMLGFAWSADHWRRKYLEAAEGWRDALESNEEALRQLAEHEPPGDDVLRVWVNPDHDIPTIASEVRRQLFLAQRRNAEL